MGLRTKFSIHLKTGKFGEVAEHGLKQITANDLAWETGPLGSNPSLSASIF